MNDAKAPSAKVFEVRATPPHGQSGPVASRYEVAGAVVALETFAAEQPAICDRVGRNGWRLAVVIPGVGEPPPRRLMNWERDRDAEVADGWLSNIAAMANTIEDKLRWEPRFCAAARWFTPCPACGGGLTQRFGRYGAFFTCKQCWFKTGVETKKGRAAELAAHIVGWCGTALEVRYGNFGNPYAGCPGCAPNYRHPTVNEVAYGRGRR